MLCKCQENGCLFLNCYQKWHQVNKVNVDLTSEKLLSCRSSLISHFERTLCSAHVHEPWLLSGSDLIHVLVWSADHKRSATVKPQMSGLMRERGYLPLVSFLMLVFANGTADRIGNESDSVSARAESQSRYLRSLIKPLITAMNTITTNHINIIVFSFLNLFNMVW